MTIPDKLYLAALLLIAVWAFWKLRRDTKAWTQHNPEVER